MIAVASLGLFVAGNQWRYGRWLMSTSYSLSWEARPPSMDEYLVNLAGFFVSPGKSVFIYSPPLLLALALAPRLWRTVPAYGRLMLVFVVPQILFHAYFRTWADETWGPRRLMNLIPVTMLPVGLFFERGAVVNGGRVAGWLALGLGFAMQLIGVGMNYASHIQSIQPHGLGTQHNLIWEPRWAHYVFQSRLLLEWALPGAEEEGRTIPYGEAEVGKRPEEFLTWNTPEAAGASRERAAGEGGRVALRAHARTLNFWWLQRAAHLGGRPIWRDRASLLLLGLIVCSGIGFTGVWIGIRNVSVPDSPIGEPGISNR